MAISFDRLCEHSEAIQNIWIAAPLPAARDDIVVRNNTSFPACTTKTKEEKPANIKFFSLKQNSIYADWEETEKCVLSFWSSATLA